jgi:hypothetical protein
MIGGEIEDESPSTNAHPRSAPRHAIPHHSFELVCRPTEACSTALLAGKYQALPGSDVTFTSTHLTCGRACYASHACPIAESYRTQAVSLILSHPRNIWGFLQSIQPRRVTPQPDSGQFLQLIVQHAHGCQPLAIYFARTPWFLRASVHGPSLEEMESRGSPGLVALWLSCGRDCQPEPIETW